MASFEDIGLRAELLRTLEDEEITTPTALQEVAIPTLRRGGNLVARATSGSGKTLAYALGILDRIEPPLDRLEPPEEGAEDPGESPLRMLVLTPTVEEAAHVGLEITPFAQALGLTVAVVGAGWGTAAAAANVVVAAAGDAMQVVAGAEIKLDALEAIVVDGASMILELGHWEAVDSLMDLLPRESQRVLLSATYPEPIEDLASRRVKRALRFPPEAAVPDTAAPAPTEGQIGYVLSLEGEKLDLLANQLREREAGPPPIIFCRSDERAADLAERLAVRGFLVGQVDEEEADVAIVTPDLSLKELMEDVEGEPGQTISFDVPADARTLRDRHLGDDDAVVLVEPRELAHLQEIARQANFRARPTPLGAGTPASAAELKVFRDQVRRAVREGDLSAQMLVLEPLFEEFTAGEVAAALALLLRRKPAAAPAQPEAAAAPPTRSPRPRPDKGTAPGPAPVTWARLFVSIGSRDEVKPGDLLGSLAGEANVPGSRFGKIEIRDNFSIVEVQSDVADQVIRAVNGTTIKGRSVRVDYDRGGPARRPDGRGQPPRRTSRPQPPRP